MARGSGLLLSLVSERHKMTTNDVSCHEAMVGTCLCHLRLSIWPNCSGFFLRLPLETLQTLIWLQGLGATLPSVPRSSPSSQRLPPDPVPSRAPARWDSIFRLCATRPVAAIPFGERLSGSVQNILFNLE